MKGLATVKILKAIEKGTGKRIHEMFDLICGTSTGGMLAVALGIKLMTLDKCEEIYKRLGECLASCTPKNVAFMSRCCIPLVYNDLLSGIRVLNLAFLWHS